MWPSLTTLSTPSPFINMKLDTLLKQLEASPESLVFSDVIMLIEELYLFTPVAFSNGALRNEAGQNSGSCKLFAFAKQHALTHQQTLHCFGSYYRVDVKQHPNGVDHQNIRNFIKTGWEGLSFVANPLQAKS